MYNITNLIEMACLINFELLYYIHKHPKGNYDEAIVHVVGVIMRASRGRYNPVIIKNIVEMHKIAFNHSNYSVPL